MKSVTTNPDLRYLVFLNGKWRWRPTKAMRRYGFAMVSFGASLSADENVRITALNAEWDACRSGTAPAPRLRQRVRGDCVYVIGFGPYVKIGWTTNFEQRFDELECRLPEPLTTYATFAAQRELEGRLLRQFSTLRIRGEWFRKEGKLAAWIEQGCSLDDVRASLGRRS